ncbi:MAG TPA: phosphatase PAP2 family protein [Longimicrobium sp.]|nr:phosphatase PAP2 family protein [Longimicrobium sp.]
MTALIARLHHHDERFLHALVRRRRPRLDRPMRAVTHLGDAAVTITAAFLLAFGVIPGLAPAGRRAAFALVSSHLVVQLLKRTVTRPRPAMPTGIEALVQPPDRFSFPSGHAASTLSVALGVAAGLPPAATPLLALLAVMVGASRCYLGVHYPGDVLAGWGLALAGLAGGALLLG